MTKYVAVPPTFRMSAIDRFTQQIVGPNGRPADYSFVFDFSRLNFIDGAGFTVLSNTISWLQSFNVSISIANFRDLRRQGIQYLDDCGLFEWLVGGRLDPSSRPRSTTLPCVSVETAKGFSWIENHLSPFLQYEIGASYASLSSVRTCVKELLNNISDHSARDTGYVHAQHYPNIRKVNITVSDFGVGIPTTIRNRFGEMSDAEAIRLACEEGVTSQSRPNNMGAGLNFLIDAITCDDGRVVIHSLKGNLVCKLEREKQVRHPSVGKGSYPGTLVDIELDTRLFEGDDEDRGVVEW